VVRYGLTTAHYRSDIDAHDGFLTEAAAAFGRIEAFLDRSSAHRGEGEELLPEAFSDALNDDLGTPQALAVVHETVRAGNNAVDAGDQPRVATLRAQVVRMLDVLGINPESPQWQEGSARDTRESGALDRLVDGVVRQRESARSEKRYEDADVFRGLLDAAGIDLTDTLEGPQWSIRDER